jgi:two-component SAPR family response regulator
VSEAKQEYSSVLKDFYTRRNEWPVHMQNFRALLARKKLIDRIPEFLARWKIVIREDRFYEFERELPDLVLFSYTGIIEYVLDVLELFGKWGNVEEAKELIKNYEGSGDNYEWTENLDIKKAYIFRYIRVFAENSDAVNFAVEELDKLFVPSFIKSF